MYLVCVHVSAVYFAKLACSQNTLGRQICSVNLPLEQALWLCVCVCVCVKGGM